MFPSTNPVFAFPLETVRVRDWEALEGRHSGGVVLDELRQIVQSALDVELAQVHHMVSIVMPVLNEEATVEQVLKAITALDFQDMGLSRKFSWSTAARRIRRSSAPKVCVVFASTLSRPARAEARQ